MRLLFNEEQHKYFYEEMPEIELVSPSGLIKLFHEPFDKQKMAQKTADKKGITVDEVLKMWKDKNTLSLEKGSAYHAYRENQYYELGKINGHKVYKHEDTGTHKVGFDILNLSPGIYPELIVDIPEYGFVGTADNVEIFEDKTFTLLDFKTNEKLDLTGYPVFDPKTKTRKAKKMYPPISHIDDCNFGHYSIQLSLYAYALECAGYTLRPQGLNIHHILFDEKDPMKAVDVVIYPVNYLKSEAKTLLTYFKKNRTALLAKLKELKKLG